MSILQINSLDKSYGSIHAVDHLELVVSKNQVYGILGPNGSGKTTTLAMIMGIIKPDSGSFLWFDQPAGPEVNKRIGALIENPNFYPYLNLIRNLKILCHIKGVDDSDIERVLRLVGLWLRRKSSYSTLSYGMKQRLMLGAVLLGDPEVLVLDEPTNGLDPEGIAEVRELIRKIAETGKTILLASHILDEVEKVCTHVAVLKRGRLLADGPVGSLIRDRDMVIVDSDETDQLGKALGELPFVDEVKRMPTGFEVHLAKGFKPQDLSRSLSSHGIVLSRLELRKQTLEQQFLEIIKNENQDHDHDQAASDRIT